MHGTAAQLCEIEGIASAVQAMSPVADILICPPSTLISLAVQGAAGRIAIGGLNCDTAICGAHTGDVSAQMVKDAGGSWVIVGHSERRQPYAHRRTSGGSACPHSSVFGGALIGEASLKAQDFFAIIRALPAQAPRIEHSVAA